ncbi:hypothetical protein LJC11_02490 [Bacteroidales bacterium OttesenSCG-928-I21]|nr:hypothetical protein [Bacteroidales bacterium OttesenSCG-928-I21]
MLKFFIKTIFITAVIITTIQGVFAQNKALSKALDKEYKQTLKQYKKDGWKIDANGRSMEVTLLKHYEKLNTNDLVVITGTSSRCNATNICKQVALNNAQNEYARLVSGKIQGAFASIIKANANRPQEEVDKISGGLLNEIEANVAGVLTPSYSIYKANSDGTKEYKTFYFVDEQKANEMLENTFERSIKETKLTIEEAKSIQKFVKDELKNETFSE